MIFMKKSTVQYLSFIQESHTYKELQFYIIKLRNEKLERNIMTRETLEQEEDPVSDSADKNNGRHIFDLVIKVNKSFSF